MLLELNISNFILIPKMRIEFGAGLNVLSGETGAGKSMILDALNLLLGKRLRSEYLRDSEQKASIEAVFEVSNNPPARKLLLERGLLDADEDLAILNRELHPNGRSTARINGRTITNSLLRELGPLLVDLQGQDDQRHLFTPAVYRRYLDRFIPDAENLGSALAVAWADWNLGRSRWDELNRQAQARRQQLGSLQSAIAELEAVNLQADEEAALMLLQERAKNSVQLLAASEQMLTELYRDPQGLSAYDRIAQALSLARKMQREQSFAELIEPLESCYFQLEDAADRLRHLNSQLDFDPKRLEEIEERLYQLRQLQKKYQRDIPQLIEYLKELHERYDELLHIEENSGRLQSEMEGLKSHYNKKAEALSRARRQAATLLEAQVDAEIGQLNMPDTVFKVDLSPQQPGPDGWDGVEFLFSANQGEAPAPLGQVASGGEVSRFILALKAALAGEYRIPTLVFDEIDMGVGGGTLYAMARKIKALARSHQIIVITHSPQLASFADQHYLITKVREGNRNSVGLHILTQAQRLTELARMQEGDDYSPLALEHAQEMIHRAQNS